MSEELKPYQEQQLKMMKLQTGFLAVILAVVLLTGIFLAVQVSGAVKAVDSLDMEKVGQIINSLESVATDLNDVDMDAINGAVTALRDAADTLSQADVDAINDGIRALSGAADNLKDIDIDKFNSLVESLQTVSSQMESTTSALAKIFGKK